MATLLLLLSGPVPALGAGEPGAGAPSLFPHYLQEKDWKEVAKIDEQIQAEFLRRLSEGGARERVAQIPFATPKGNVVPSLEGPALPLSGLVVTHSMDNEPGKMNDVRAYLAEGYDCLAVDKKGRIFVRGKSFLRTNEPNVPNRSTINLTFDINAERGERLSAAQVAAAADIAEALQRAFNKFGTQVRIHFKDHHDSGLKPGKKYYEAGPARDAANERLKNLGP